MGISDTLLEEIIHYAKKYHIEKVILFGSRARGDHKERSDIDIAYTGGDGNRFALDLQEETNTLLFFDCVNLDHYVQEELLQSIKKDGIILYEKV